MREKIVRNLRENAFKVSVLCLGYLLKFCHIFFFFGIIFMGIYFLEYGGEYIRYFIIMKTVTNNFQLCKLG